MLFRSPDQTLCPKGSWAAARQRALVAVEGQEEDGGVLPDRHLPWGSGVLSADGNGQPTLAGPLCQASSSRKSQTRASLCQGHSPQPGGGEPGPGQGAPRLGLAWGIPSLPGLARSAEGAEQPGEAVCFSCHGQCQLIRGTVGTGRPGQAAYGWAAEDTATGPSPAWEGPVG